MPPLAALVYLEPGSSVGAGVDTSGELLGIVSTFVISERGGISGSIGIDLTLVIGAMIGGGCGSACSGTVGKFD